MITGESGGLEMGQTLLEREEALEWEAGLQELHGRMRRVSAVVSLVSGCWRTCKDCWGRWSARTGGSWPNMLATPLPTVCSVCWRCTTGTRTTVQS